MRSFVLCIIELFHKEIKTQCMSIHVLYTDSAIDIKFDVLYFLLVMKFFTKHSVHTHFNKIVLLNGKMDTF